VITRAIANSTILALDFYDTADLGTKLVFEIPEIHGKYLPYGGIKCPWQPLAYPAMTIISFVFSICIFDIFVACTFTRCISNIFHVCTYTTYTYMLTTI
jgi:hypothetical protein